jgi:UDP:flavonoid glycosyltransferase YjiC (YdhE family)
MATKFIFTGTGTRGDLIPLLTIAKEMLRRGHGCHVLFNDPSGNLAERFGVPFTSTAPAQLDNLAGVERAFRDHVFASYQGNFEFIEAELERGAELVLVSQEPYAASTLMAERHGLPLCRLTIAPFGILSLEQPCFPLSESLRGPEGVAYRRDVLPRLLAAHFEHPYVLPAINRFREALGLVPLLTLRELDRPVSHHLCAFPSWYCAPAPDWPQALDCVGFPLSPPEGTLPEGLARFIDAHGPPLVFTPGTGVVDVAEFFSVARECCARLRRPGLFLSPNFSGQSREQSGPIYHLDYLDLALVLPRAALLVHHGGIGTTARALEAGIPQIICPQAFDQPDNGDRVSRLGVGHMIPRAQLSVETLSVAAHRLLASRETQARLDALSRQIRVHDGPAAAADVLEREFVLRRAAE